MVVYQSVRFIGQNQSLTIFNKICRVILFQPYLLVIKPSYLRIYKELSMLSKKLFKN